MIYMQILIYNHLPRTFVEGITLRNKLVGQIVMSLRIETIQSN